MNYFPLMSLLIFLPGCGTSQLDTVTRDAFIKSNLSAGAGISRSIHRDEDKRVTETNRVLIPVIPSANSDISSSGWLSKKRIALNLSAPLPLNEVIKIFWSQGINISTTLPVDSYMYGGLGINNTDAESALKIVMSNVGLDYQLDNVRKIVLIKPLESRTWYLNLGKRSSSYSSGNSGGGGNQNLTVQQSGSANSVAGSGTTQNSNTGLTGGSSTNGSSSGAVGATGITSGENFWVALDDELKKRLTILVPSSGKNARDNSGANSNTTPIPLNLNQPIPPSLPLTAGSPPAQPASQASGLYVTRQVGGYSLNPETGAVNIQAPHWILNDLDVYLNRVKAMYNTSLTFTGELVLLTSDSAQSEGLDISSFGRFASTNYGLALKNNGLGGITISVPTNGLVAPVINSGRSPISTTLLGVTNLTNGLQIFNAYLSNHGSVSVLQKPVLSTTSGVPVEFSKIVTQYFNTVTQQASTGSVGGAATATQNTLVPVDLGTVVKINPRFDLSTGLIRAQISLYQTLQSGTQTISQSLTAGNSVQQIPSDIPIVTKLNYSGEALLQDGDVIVVGGQQDDSSTLNSDGITGLKDSFFGGIFGNKTTRKGKSNYYFALRVSVDKREGNSVELN
jgi:hypothetical protein